MATASSIDTLTTEGMLAVMTEHHREMGRLLKLMQSELAQPRPGVLGPAQMAVLKMDGRLDAVARMSDQPRASYAKSVARRLRLLQLLVDAGRPLTVTELLERTTELSRDSVRYLLKYPAWFHCLPVGYQATPEGREALARGGVLED